MYNELNEVNELYELNDITIVTAFLDIGRDKWPNSEFKRTTEFYIDSFLHYLNYPYKMVCYIDEKYIDKVIQVYEKSLYQNKKFIPINREWLTENTHAWKNIHNDIHILNSKPFKNFLGKRLEVMYPNGIPDENRREHLFPENIYPEYNVLNHAKIDLINYSIEKGYIKTYFTGWSDFGYFASQHNLEITKFHKNILDINKFKRNKISFILRKPIDERDKNMEYTLFYAPNVFTGTFFCGPTDLMFPLQELYHNCTNELYRNFISDDDQHVYLRCYLKTPDLFDLHIIPDDIKPLSFFEKEI